MKNQEYWLIYVAQGWIILTRIITKENNSQITDSEIDTLLKDTRQKKIVITEKGKKFKKDLLKKYKNLKND